MTIQEIQDNDYSLSEKHVMIIPKSPTLLQIDITLRIGYRLIKTCIIRFFSHDSDSMWDIYYLDPKEI